MILTCPFCKTKLTCEEPFDPYDISRDNYHCEDCISTILAWSAKPYLLSRTQALYNSDANELLSVSIIIEPDLFLITTDYMEHKTHIGRYVKIDKNSTTRVPSSINADGFIFDNLLSFDEVIDLWDGNISERAKFWITYS